MSTMHEEVREDLREAYGQDLPPARFGLDDVLAGGRRRRRRRQAAQVAGSAFAVAALAGVVATGASLTGVGGVQPAARPATSPAASCTTEMGECAWRVSEWAKDAGVPYAESARFTFNPKGGERWEAGTWRLDAPLTNDNGGLRTTDLAITLSPTTTVPVGSRVDWSGFTTTTLRLADGETATGYQESGGVKATATWLVPASPGVHPAVEVGFTAVDQVARRAAVPTAASPERVRALLDILTGPGRTQVPDGQRDTVNGPNQPGQKPPTAVADPVPAVRGWLVSDGHPDVTNAPHSVKQGDGWAVPSFTVGAVELSVRVAPEDPVPAGGRSSMLVTHGGLTVRLQQAVSATGTQEDYVLADERFAGRTVAVTVWRPGGATATLTHQDVLRLVDALASR